MKQNEIETTTDYPQPSSELIDEIRKRLLEIPPDVLERAHHALMHEHIDVAGSILYRAGVCFCSAELYEYRKTLFPPNALLDPMTSGAPVLREKSSRPISLIGHIPPDAPTETEPPSKLVTTPTPHETHVTDLTNLTHLTSDPQSSTPPLPNPSLNPQPSTIGAQLLTDLRDVINRYVVLPEMAAETLALWVVHTYAFTLRQVTTYIGVVSPEKRCGKTTLLELLARLANRSLTAANISPSAMFRVIEETQPTLLIDEADTFLEGRDELAGILNAGYRKGNSYVVRVADRRKKHKHPGGTSYTSPQDDITPEFAEWSTDPIDSLNDQTSTLNPSAAQFAKYSCWCPKVMAAIGRLPDTLADRCIIITMQRKTAAEKCERMRQLNATELRKRCAEFVRQNRDKIAHSSPEIPSTLNDRAADIWEPLLAIADLGAGRHAVVTVAPCTVQNWRKPNYTGPNFLDGTSCTLNPPAPCGDDQRLTERMHSRSATSSTSRCV